MCNWSACGEDFLAAGGWVKAGLSVYKAKRRESQTTTQP